MNRDELYRIWKAEKNEKGLQKLPSSFYAEIARLLNDSKVSSAGAGQDQTQKAILEREYNILRRLGSELAETRMKKIIDAALSRQDIPIDFLTHEEEQFAKEISIRIGDHCRFIDQLTKAGPQSEKPPPSKPVEARLELVRFLSDFPAIIGVDLKTYGPFKAEDIATLPAENASALINQGVVKQVRFSEGAVSDQQ